MAKVGAVLVVLLFSFVTQIRAHARLVCPPPRNPDVGAKLGPCGHPDDLSIEPLELKPGLNTIVFEEAVYHYAAPVRLALSSGQLVEDAPGTSDFESCVLLDHVPHGDAGLPKNMSLLDPSTFVKYAISVIIPDVMCERCQLQLISAMTDFIHGVPEGTDCALAGETLATSGDKRACPAVYHSCAPVTIKGAADVSSTPLSCGMAATDLTLEWPFNNKQQVGVYTFEGDPGNWTGNFPRLADGDSQEPGKLPPYAQRAGPCADFAPPVDEF